MTEKTKGSRFTVLLPDKLREQVDLLASKEDMSAGQITRRALKKYVEQTCKATK